MTLPKLDNDRFVPEHGLRIVVQVPETLAVGEFHTVRVVDALGPDLVAEAIERGE